jgi:hypothetical protein
MGDRLSPPVGVSTRHARPASRGRRLALASIVGLAVAYGILAFGVLEPDATYSVDATVKYIQARTLLVNRLTQSGIPNRGSFVDPEGRFFPLSPPYVFNTPAGWQSIFPTASALLQAPFSPWGLSGVTVPAIFAACLLLWVTWRFGSGGPGEGAVPVLLGVATILWFYATSPNEHALSAALTTGALIAAGTGGRSVYVAGLLLGLAGTLRDESLLVAPGLVIARYLAGTRSLRLLAQQTAAMAGMTLLPLLAVAGLDMWVYHRPASAHLLHAVAPLQRWLPADSVRSLPALPVIPWAERPDVLVHQWLIGLGTTLDKGLVVAALLAAIAIRRWTGSALGLVAVLGWLAAWRVTDVAVLTTVPKFVGGLYRLCPFLVFALVPLPKGTPPSRARTLAIVTCAAYLALAIFGLNTIGGKSFGPRLLFPMLPLLTVAATQSIVAWVRRFRESLLDGTVGAIGIVMVAAAVVMQFAVALPAWAARNHSDHLTIAGVAANPDEIVVVDHVSGVQMTTPFYFERVVFLTTSQRAADALSELLVRARVGAFSVLSRGEQDSLTFPGFACVNQVREGRLVRQRWRR